MAMELILDDAGTQSSRDNWGLRDASDSHVAAQDLHYGCRANRRDSFQGRISSAADYRKGKFCVNKLM